MLTVIRSLGLLLVSLPVMAQSYPNYPAPQPVPAPQEVSDNRAYIPPASRYPVYYAQPQQVQQAPQQQAQPSADPGSSVLTDIRQMNF